MISSCWFHIRCNVDLLTSLPLWVGRMSTGDGLLVITREEMPSST